MKKYKTILIDPPWNERGRGKIKRGADKHYNLLKTDDIISIIKGSTVFTPADDCHLYLWVTNNFLEDGLRVMSAIGFRYITNLVWVKGRFGLGYYFRGQHELLLFGVRGKLKPLTKSQSTIIRADRLFHSKKPEMARLKIQCVSPGPRLEMFAREAAKEWDSWGDEMNINQD